MPRNRDQVHITRHEAIARQLHLVLLTVFAKQIHVEFSIRIGEEGGARWFPRRVIGYGTPRATT